MILLDDKRSDFRSVTHHVVILVDREPVQMVRCLR